jgi:hydroxymethylpyrimidine pyrophosphatase-like HAD family hydrolase
VGYDAGDVVISVNVKHEKELESALASAGTTFHVIKNIASLMILPPGVSKGTGMSWLRKVYGVSLEETAGIGDAENDLVMRSHCGLLGAVRNALPAMKGQADYVTEGEYGEGLAEFIRLIRKENGK